MSSNTLFIKKKHETNGSTSEDVAAKEEGKVLQCNYVLNLQELVGAPCTKHLELNIFKRDISLKLVQSHIT